MGQDLAYVVAAGVQDGEDSIADGALQGASGQAAIGFHVADFGFYGASAAEVRDEFWCQAAPCAADQNAGPGLGMGDILFHHSGVDRHAPYAVLVNGAGLLPDLDRLGQ